MVLQKRKKEEEAILRSQNLHLEPKLTLQEPQKLAFPQSSSALSLHLSGIVFHPLSLRSFTLKSSKTVGILVNSQSQSSHSHSRSLYNSNAPKIHSLFSIASMPSLIFNQPMKFFFTTLFFLFLFISHSVSSSSSQETQPQFQNPSKTISQYHQVFYLKNTDPIFVKRHHHNIKNRNKHKKNLLKMKNKKKNLLKSRVFSVMLPKGFVPPSASSPCHNQQPDSASFHCHLSATKP